MTIRRSHRALAKSPTWSVRIDGTGRVRTVSTRRGSEPAAGEFDVPIYNFRTRGPGASDRSITEVEFPDDAAATADARQALADAARDAALENRKTVDEIVVTSPTGVVIATVTLLGCQPLSG
jgi:hypothetical protein